MTSRVSKKMLTPFETSLPTGAILMINLFDPQISTTKLFLEAITTHHLPHLVIGNKMDLVDADEIARVEKELGTKINPVSLTKNYNTDELTDMLLASFPVAGRIVVLGVFNTGKTSLIAHLTGLKLKISNMPGTTLSFEEYRWCDRILIDTVGQVIDINRPLMVGYDFSGLDTPTEMFDHAMRQEAEGILSSIDTARPGLIKAVAAIKERLKAGGKIVSTGAGASGLVAEEIAGQFFETGVICISVTNAFSQGLPISFAKGVAEEEAGLARFIAAHLNASDVLIAVSASGGTGFVYEALRLAREKGALGIAITENKDTPMGVNADIIIHSSAKPEGPSSTRIQTAHLAIGHALVCILAAVRGLSAEESIGFMMPEYIATKKMGIK